MKIKVVIIDDEYLSIKELSFLLSKIPYITVIGKADCGMDGLNLIKELQPDVAFVDIMMPDITGIQLSKEINKLDNKCKIIFSTAYDQYAIEAFDVNAIDYILKPYEEERVLKAAKKAKDQIENAHMETNNIGTNTTPFNKLSVLKDDKLILIEIDTIILMYTEDRNIYIKTKEETFLSSYSLQELEERLRGKGFFRTHRSYLVNLNKIKEISPWFNGAYIAKLDGLDDEVPISRNHVKPFKKVLGI